MIVKTIISTIVGAAVGYGYHLLMASMKSG